MTIIGLILFLLALVKKLPPFTLHWWVRGGEASVAHLLLCWGYGMLGLLAFILEPSWRSYFFFLMVIGLTTAGFGTYLYITQK